MRTIRVGRKSFTLGKECTKNKFYKRYYLFMVDLIWPLSAHLIIPIFRSALVKVIVDSALKCLSSLLVGQVWLGTKNRKQQKLLRRSVGFNNILLNILLNILNCKRNKEHWMLKVKGCIVWENLHKRWSWEVQLNFMYKRRVYLFSWFIRDIFSIRETEWNTDFPCLAWNYISQVLFLLHWEV